MTMRVIKIGGNEIDQPDFLGGLSAAVTAMEGPPVLVHGGGKEITAALERYGVVTEFVNGIRVTTSAAIGVVEQILSAAVNKRIVARLNAAGVSAIGLSGVDLQLIKTVPLQEAGHDWQRTGAVAHVRGDVLRTLLAQGWVPVISPVSVDRDDHMQTNVNADLAALAVANALEADELVFVSNVPGVLIHGQVVPEMNRVAVETAIQTGAIHGGMVPKVRAAIDALAAVRAVRICDLAGLGTGGTRFIAGKDHGDD